MMIENLIGKRYKEEPGQTINIFDEIPLRMKISFSSSGDYSFESSCAHEDADHLMMIVLYFVDLIFPKIYRQASKMKAFTTDDNDLGEM